ncbi:MAG: hypothetical protein ACYTG2_03630 [Planctomycetota bacterium]
MTTIDSASPTSRAVSRAGRRRYLDVVADDPATTDERADDERVRICLACGQMVAYAQRICPSCGHEEPLGADDPGTNESPCRACGETKLERLLYCPACGVEARPPRTPRAAPWSSPPAGGVESFTVVLALVAPVLVLIALLQVVLGAVGGRPA